jgi:hypothetical protein
MVARERFGIDAGFGLTLGLAVLGVLCVVALPRDGRAMLVALPHVASERLIDTLARADAELVAVGALSGLYVVASDRPGLAGRLWEAGAFLVVDAALALGCRPVGAIGGPQ